MAYFSIKDAATATISFLVGSGAGSTGDPYRSPLSVATGAQDDAAASSDTGTFSLIALFKRHLAFLTASRVAATPLAVRLSSGSAFDPAIASTMADPTPTTFNLTTNDAGLSVTANSLGQSVVTGTPTPASFQDVTVTGCGMVRVTISSTAAGVAKFAASADGGSTFVAVTGWYSGTGSSSTASLSGTETQVYLFNLAGRTTFRVWRFSGANALAGKIQPALSDDIVVVGNRVSTLDDRTTPTVTTVVAPVVVAASTDGTAATLDLRTTGDALLTVMIGRRSTTAPTNGGAYVMIRRSLDGTTLCGNRDYDRVANTTTAVAPTVSSGGVAGTKTVVVSANTGLAIGNTIQASDPTTASRFQVRTISFISGTTITVDEAWASSLSASDIFVNNSDSFQVALPRGWHYTITPCNPSAGAMTFAVYAGTKA